MLVCAVVAAESGELLYWDIRSKAVIFQDRQEDIQQIFFYKSQTRCVVVSKHPEVLDPKVPNSTNAAIAQCCELPSSPSHSKVEEVDPFL